MKDLRFGLFWNEEQRTESAMKKKRSKSIPKQSNRIEIDQQKKDRVWEIERERGIGGGYRREMDLFGQGSWIKIIGIILVS